MKMFTDGTIQGTHLEYPPNSGKFIQIEKVPKLDLPQNFELELKSLYTTLKKLDQKVERLK